MLKVCILAAGKGSRNHSAKFSNKALLPVFNRAAISLIMDTFPDDTNFIIAVGHNSVMIKDYLEVSVKNDDALVKLAAVVQRLVTAANKDDDENEFGLTEAERARLIEEAESEIKKIKQETIEENVDGNRDSYSNIDKKSI